MTSVAMAIRGKNIKTLKMLRFKESETKSTFVGHGEGREKSFI